MNQIYLDRYQKLNPEQKQAVDTINGPVMVVAGPGTGKTEILSMRITNILQKNPELKPQEILALTFTDSGAKAMKKRLADIIGPAGYKVNVFTFHSFCNNIINSNPDEFLIRKEMEPISDIDKVRLLKELIDTLPNGSALKPFGSPYHHIKNVLSRISQLKKDDVTAKQFEQHVIGEIRLFKSIPDTEKYHQKGAHVGKMKGIYKDQAKNLEQLTDLAVLYNAYQEKLTKQSQYDFEDMIMLVIKKFKENNNFKSKYQEAFKYILVDEYQDSNNAQNEIILHLVDGQATPNLFVVGDDDQSIYCFQGASMENILLFGNKFKNIKLIPLKKNYRSTQNIIDASISLVDNNRLRLNKVLDLIPNSTLKGFQKTFEAFNTATSTKVSIAKLSSEDMEYYYVFKKIKELVSSGKKIQDKHTGHERKLEYSDIAIIYRKNAHSKKLMDYFKKEAIPFTVTSDVNILDNVYVQKLLSLLKIIKNPKSDTDFFNFIFSDIFDIAPEDVFRLTNGSFMEKQRIYDLIQDKEKLSKLNIKSITELENILVIINDLQKDFHNMQFSNFVIRALNRSGILKKLLERNNIYDLNQVQSFSKWVQTQNQYNHAYGLEEMTKDLDFMANNFITIPADDIFVGDAGVKLMTAHKSKGLEFPIVFLLKGNEHIWEGQTQRDSIKLPESLLIQNKIDIETDKQVEDERRLFYVAMTRAEKELYISYSLVRADGKVLLPSIFLNEIKQELTVQEDVSAYEKDFTAKAVLELTFDEGTWKEDVSQQFLKELANQVVLNPTAINNYLKCPCYFKYNNLYRIPTESNKAAAFGSLIHMVLEKVFQKAKAEQKTPPLDFWIKTIDESIDKVFATKDDKQAVRDEAIKQIGSYYNYYKGQFHTNCLLEYNFRTNNVMLDDIPITGKLDKIEIHPNNEVIVIDYKTGEPKTEKGVRGLNKDGNKDYFRQLVFYKLLTQLDEDFPYKMSSAILDFVKAKDNGEHTRLVFYIQDEEIEELRKEIKRVWLNIQELKFEPTEKEQECQGFNSECQYYKLCNPDPS